MKLVCEKEKLLLGLNNVIRSSVGRTTNPILDGILITLKNNQVIFTTNDLEIGMEYILNEGDIIEEGNLEKIKKDYNPPIYIIGRSHERITPNFNITIDNES